MKTRLLYRSMMISGLLFCLSIFNAIAWIIFALNFWHLLIVLGTAILTVVFGVLWTKHVEQDPNRAINDLNTNDDE